VHVLVVTRWRSATHPVSRFAAAAAERVPTTLVAAYEGDRADVPGDALAVDVAAGPWISLARAVRQARRRRGGDVVVTDLLDVSFNLPTVVAVDRAVGGRTGGFRTWLHDRTVLQRLRAADRVVAPSLHGASRLLPVGLAADRVRVIPHAIPSADGPAVGSDDGRVRILCWAPLEAARAAHVAIDAIARLPRDEKRRVHLDVVGPANDPVYVDQLRVQAWEQPVEVHPGASAERFLAAADLLLAPTLRDEHSADEVVAAMGRDVCVVWTEHPALRELTGGHGFAVEPTAEALRDRVRAMLRDPAPFREQGRVGGRFVRERYGWHAVWPLWERLLSEVSG
jgi:glycosyltransferase involved in cell wall biosynthesis